MSRGFTIVELLVCLALAAVLLTMALPGFRALVAEERGRAAMNQLLGMVASARAHAVLQRHTVTLCPGRAGECLGRNQWHEGALLFVDRNANGDLDGEEHVASAAPPLPDGARLYWRSFRNRSYLQFQPRGYTRWQNGSFLYCPPDDDDRAARMAVINPQGRVRISPDADGDGIVEDARGRPVSCPP